MGCCSFRRVRLGLDGKSLHSAQGSWAFTRLSGEVNLVLRGLAGQELHLTFPATAPLQELREAVHERWKIPLLAQQFVRDSAIISGAPETAIGLLLELPEGGDIDLTCIRRQLPPAEQYAVDCRLLQAVAAAADQRHDGIRAALVQGARPGGLGVPEASPAVRSAPSPLQIARALGDTSAAELLLAAGAEEDAEEMVKRDEKEFPSIRRAFAARNLRAVVRCLARGEDVNTWLRRGDGVQDTSGGTPLHACCAQHQLPGATAVVALLCNLRADVNAGDSEGDSPLAHARYFGAKEMEELLRAHGAQLRGPYYQYRLMRR